MWKFHMTKRVDYFKGCTEHLDWLRCDAGGEAGYDDGKADGCDDDVDGIADFR